MNRDEFIQQYVLSRTSHKLSADQLINDAEDIWNRIYTQPTKRSREHVTSAGSIVDKPIRGLY